MRFLRSSLRAAAMCAALSSGAAGCDRGPKPPAPPPPAASLRVEVAGCAAVLAGPICEVKSGASLTVWAKESSGAPVRVLVGGSAIGGPGVPSEGGARFVAPVGALPSELTVLAGERTAPYTLRLTAARDNAALAEAEKLRRSGKLAEAEERVTALVADADPAVRARAKSKLARIERARGRLDEAFQGFREAIKLHRSLGLVSDEENDRFAFAFALIEQAHGFAEAHEVLDGAAQAGELDAEALAQLPYYKGKLAFERGDLRGALAELLEAERGLSRLGLEGMRVDAAAMRAEVLRALGRLDEAIALLGELRRSLAGSGDACREADVANNLGWTWLDALDASERREQAAREAVSFLREALELYRASCPEPEMIASTLANLSQVSLSGESPDTRAARSYLAEARAAQPEARLKLRAQWLDLDARILLAEGNARGALAAYERLRALAERALLPQSRWQAAIGRARAFEALGRGAEVVAAYRQAEQLLDEQARSAPLGAGRGSFVDRREDGVRRGIDFLLARGDARGAALAARRSRTRVLATVAWTDRLATLDPPRRKAWDVALEAYWKQREALEREAAGDWKLPTAKLTEVTADRRAREQALREALDQALAALRAGSSADEDLAGAASAPAAGEALLVLHPVIGGWAGFAVTEAGVIGRRLGAVDPSAPPASLSKALLEPFRDVIASVARLRLLPYGALAALDLHALPWDDQALGARVTVTYGVDLGARGADRSPSAGAGRRALVIADPRGNLPGARGEAAEVSAALLRSGFTVERLDGEAATHAAVRSAVEGGGELLHYAGHGVFRGIDGWESGLPLAAGGWLTVADVLALRGVPRHIWLSGCETARDAPEGKSAGLGVAQAFVIAGALSVVAATRPIDDALAERVMRAAQGRAGSLDPADALRAAEAQVAAETPLADWAAFRVLVP